MLPIASRNFRNWWEVWLQHLSNVERPNRQKGLFNGESMIKRQRPNENHVVGHFVVTNDALNEILRIFFANWELTEKIQLLGANDLRYVRQWFRIHFISPMGAWFGWKFKSHEERKPCSEMLLGLERLLQSCRSRPVFQAGCFMSYGLQRFCCHRRLCSFSASKLRSGKVWPGCFCPVLHSVTTRIRWWGKLRRGLNLIRCFLLAMTIRTCRPKITTSICAVPRVNKCCGRFECWKEVSFWGMPRFWFNDFALFAF